MNAVIVTGGNGFLGKHLIMRLLAKGYYVYNIVRHPGSHFEQEKNYRELICTNRQEIPELYSQICCPVKYLFHFGWAGVSGEEQAALCAQLENIEFSCKLLQLAEQIQIEKFLFAGSIMEYECLCNVLQDNSDYKTNIYAAAKVSAHLFLQQTAQNKGIGFIPILISNIYGMGENSPRFVNSLVRKMRTERSIALTEGTRPYDFIYISDAVEMMILIAELGKKHKQYYIGNEQQRPLREFVQRAADCIGYTGKLDFGAIPYRDIPLTYKEFNVHAFYEDFSYRPTVSFEEGIQKIYKEMEANHESSNFSRGIRHENIGGILPKTKTND